MKSREVGVDRVGLRGWHAVREAVVRLQRPVREEFRGQWSGVRIGHDLIVITVHHQCRHRDLLQILSEVGLGEGDDAVVVGLGAPIMP